MSISTHRQCSFEIKNKSSKYTLSEPLVHLVSGNSEVPLPPTIGPSETGSALFMKTPNTACGSVGVLTYDLLQEPGRQFRGRMAVMFSVPYDFVLYSNWFGLGVFGRDMQCNKELFNNMYKGMESGFVRGKAKGPSLTHRSDHVTVRATMSDSYQPVLRVEVCNS
ncbi:deep-sea actinoporin Cjtox I-like [Odontesthes bonariensis]|uniref:deep-sea actinoporin Cjtox I-like n=1 Tax=Odontesthes bonariensis TaxID=219752 RepID=UPI003F58C855